MKKYLIFYTTTRGGVCGSVARDKLPEKSTITVGMRRHYHWWYLTPNEDGVYHRPTSPLKGLTERGSTGPYSNWRGDLPDNWLDRDGNLRGRDGQIIFKP